MPTIACLIATGAACGGSPGGASTCPQIWTPSANPGSVTFTSGALVLDAPATSAMDMAAGVSQGGLVGDFTVAVQFDSFSTSSSASSAGNFDAELTTSVAQFDGIFLGSSVATSLTTGSGSTPTGKTQSATGSGGTITFSRQGTTGTVTVTVAGQSLTQSGEIGSTPATLLLLAVPASSGADTVVHITKVTATSPGTFQADSFTCDGLR